MRCFVLLIVATFLPAEDPTFQTQSRLVIVPTVVTDEKGRSINELDSASFIVFDNGRPRRIAVDTLATGVASIALVIAVQSSGISGAALEKVQRIGSMIQPLVTGERGCAGLLSFDEAVHWLQECTKDADLLVRAFSQLRTGESKTGRMLDAVDAAVDHLRHLPNLRRVLLLISESRDRGSESELENILLDAQAAGVTVYAITYSSFKTGFTSKTAPPPDPPREDPRRPQSTRTEPLTAQGRAPIPPAASRVDVLGGIGELARMGKEKTTEVLSRGTGGTTFSFVRQTGLESAIEKLGAELHSQYLLSFMPPHDEPGYHLLEVRIPARPKLRIRARPGYWKAEKTQ
ncbi:MAG TPA: VWA domain-containing protein [Bryobacteraceae bacterium]|nr:VWA domain-containing protein [Bryobacteraceae bacterium]